jgi:hypothetical protein
VEAVERSRFRAEVEIVAGYAVAAIGALIGFISWAGVGSLRYSSNFDVQAIAALFAYFAGFAGWWFLTQIAVDNAGPQRRLLRRALTGLALEQLFVAIGVLAIEVAASEFGWSNLGSTLIGAGALLSALGFCSMQLTYRDGFGERATFDSSSS